MMNTHTQNNLAFTILTQHYAPFIYKPPYYLHKFAVEVYLSPIYAPIGHTWKIYKNNWILWLRRMRVRLELTIQPCIESSYLLASDTPTKWLATQRQAHGGACENCIAFSDCTHSAPSLTFALQNWATMSFIASRTRWWWTILPLLFPLCAPQRGKGAYKWH